MQAVRAINNPRPAYTSSWVRRQQIKSHSNTRSGSCSLLRVEKAVDRSRRVGGAFIYGSQKKRVGSLRAAIKNKEKKEREKKCPVGRVLAAFVRVGCSFRASASRSNREAWVYLPSAPCVGVSPPPPPPFFVAVNAIMRALQALNSDFLVLRLIRQLKLGCF